MASKFNVWIDDGQVTGSNTLSLTDDSQKKVGFKAGTAASSQRVNTILRETSLVSTALMNIFDSNGTCTYASPLSAVQALMSSYFNGFVPSTRKVAGHSLTKDVSLGKLTVKLNGVSFGEYNGSTDAGIDLTNVMTLNTQQTITERKTFTGPVRFNSLSGIVSAGQVTIKGEETVGYYFPDKIRTADTHGSNEKEYSLPTESGTLLVDKNIKLYRHNIQIRFTNTVATGNVAFSILSFTNSTPLTSAVDMTALAFFSSTIANKYIVCSGYMSPSASNQQIAEVIMYSDNRWSIRADYVTTYTFDGRGGENEVQLLQDDVETISLPSA